MPRIYLSHESGQCIPRRSGTPRLRKIINKTIIRKGRNMEVKVEVMIKNSIILRRSLMINMVIP